MFRELFRGALGAGRPIQPLPDAARDAAALLRRTPDLVEIWGRHRVDPVLREMVMYTVARANECRWCSFLHGEWARHVGVSEEVLRSVAAGDTSGLGTQQAAAVRWARARTLASPDEPAATTALAHELGDVSRRDLEVVADAMNLANLTANSFDALLSRLQGHPHPAGRLPDELVLAALFAPSIVAALFVSALAWGRSPVELARRFAEVSRELDPPSGDGSAAGVGGRPRTASGVRVMGDRSRRPRR